MGTSAAERQRRSRAHRAGDHSLCVPERCDQAPPAVTVVTDPPAVTKRSEPPVTLAPEHLRPRVCTHPPYERSHGGRAVALMRRAGQVMDGWQVDALDLLMAVRTDGRWVCTEYCEWCPRQNGKGGILEARALCGLMELGERLIIWTAHEYKTAMEAFRRVLWLLGKLGEKRSETLYVVDGVHYKVSNTNGDEGIERLDTGARIRFLARSKGSGRGFSCDLLILDETFALTSDQHSALMPTMLARPNPQIVYASSPPLDGASAEVMYLLRERGDPGAPRSVDAEPWSQDPELGYRDWGQPGELENLDDVDLADEQTWRASNPATDTRIPIEAIRRAFRSMPRERFAREIIGIWPRRLQAGGGEIPAELWRDLAVSVRERPADVAFAVQVNARRTHAAIVACGPLPDGRLLLSVVAYGAGTQWVAERVARLRETHNPVAIAIQDKGPSGTVLLGLGRFDIRPPADKDAPRRGELAVPWAADVAIAYSLMVDALRERRLVHLNEGPLNAAIGSAATRPLSGGTAWDYRPDEAAPLLAGTLAVWAWLTLHDRVNVEYDPLACIG